VRPEPDTIGPTGSLVVSDRPPLRHSMNNLVPGAIIPPHRIKYKTASLANGARKEIVAPVDLISPDSAGVPFAGSIHS